MAHHGHRHDRISRLIRAKHRLEASDADADANADSHLLSGVETTQDAVFASEALSDKDCDPSQNITCLDDAADPTEVLIKRQEAQTPTTTVVETVVEVVDTNSQTLWLSSGVNFPMTISDSAFGTITLTGSSTSSAGSLLPSSVANATATQSTLSQSTESTAPTTKQLGAIPSPKPSSSAISSVPRTSTRLIPTASTTTTSWPTSTSVFVAGNYYSSSSSSSTTILFTDSSYTTYTPTSTTGFDSTQESGYSTGSGSGSGSGSESAPTTSQTQSSSGSGSGIDPKTSKIVGGVVGSVAGLAMIFLVLFYLFRRRKLLLQQKGAGALPLPSDDGGTTREVTTRSSNDPLFSASYLAPAFMKRWRQSTMTVRSDSTISSSNPSERGFQKISGRKIPPVLTHGGDGYGGGLEGDSPTIPGFPPVSPVGGPTSSPSSQAPPPTTPFGMVLDTKYTQEAEERAESPVRPSPVHLPVSSTVNFGVATTVTPSHPIAQPQSAVAIIPQQPDGVGRSLPSYDGSRSSRFTESIDR